MAFASLRNADVLAWQQASMFAKAIEIVRADSLAGILRYEGWGINCDATCADGMWHFRRHGFLWNKLSVTPHGDSREIVEYKSGFRRGTLRVGSGDVYTWKLEGVFVGKAVIQNASGFVIASYTPKAFSFRRAGTVTIAREYHADPQLPLLIMLGVYLTVQNQRRRRA